MDLPIAEVITRFNSTNLIYHGSDKIIKQPQYGFGNVRNDYGQGFYCTEEIERAGEWAAGQSESGHRGGEVSEKTKKS